MAKGSRVGQFAVGDRISYKTDIGQKVYDRDDKFLHKTSIVQEAFGRITKLHMSGRQGVAEIMPEHGGRKLSRKLQHVTKSKEVAQ